MESAESRSAVIMKRLCLLFNVLLLILGNCGGPMLMRLYFLHGGHSPWFSAFLETAGFPFILLPLLALYAFRRRTSPSLEIVLMKPRLLAASVLIGLVTGLIDYLYAFGMGKLPLSTSSVIVASQLAFTAFFAYLFVNQKFTPYTINAIVTLLVGAVVLAAHSNGDRPLGQSTHDYFLGFVTTFAAAFLYGVILPFMELTYKKAKQPITYTGVLEIQFVSTFVATAFCTVGMFVSGEMRTIPTEAATFELGAKMYILVIVGSAASWQCFYLGATGVIFYASSLLSSIIIHALLPVTELLAIVFYREKFYVDKAIALFLALWGFTSYFYGEIRQQRKEKQNHKETLQQYDTPQINFV